MRDTVKKAGELHLHIGTVRHGALRVGDAVELRVESGRRRQLRANHSVTHLLHQALRHRLGEHVTQKGSLVAPDRLRFDFSHPKPLTQEDIAAIEAEVNARIRDNGEVRTRLLTPERAVAEGALALFGEKYGDEVRVVAMGAADDPVRPYSVELCGGTHVRRTGDIGMFKIIGESAVASGVRRIEALTGAAAEAHVAGEEALLRQAASALRTARPSCRCGCRGWSRKIAGSSASWPRRDGRWRWPVRRPRLPMTAQAAAPAAQADRRCRLRGAAGR